MRTHALKSIREVIDSEVEGPLVTFMRQYENPNWTPPNCPNCGRNDEIVDHYPSVEFDFFCNRCNGAF